MIKKEDFFNYQIDESILYERSVSVFVCLIFIDGAFDIITRLLFRLIRGVKRLENVIRFQVNFPFLILFLAIANPSQSYLFSRLFNPLDYVYQASDYTDEINFSIFFFIVLLIQQQILKETGNSRNISIFNSSDQITEAFYNDFSGQRWREIVSSLELLRWFSRKDRFFLFFFSRVCWFSIAGNCMMISDDYIGQSLACAIL